jgi:hypothetical protein
MDSCKKYLDLKHWWYWVAGPLALLWVLVRSGSNPKRVVYPCQRAAMPIAASWLLAVAAFFTGSLIFRKFAKVSLVVISIAGVIWFIGSVSRLGQSQVREITSLPVWEVYEPVSTVFVIDSIPPTSGSLAAGDATVPDEHLPDPAMDTLLAMLESGGIYLHKTTVRPDGIVGPEDVVIIKGNFQWTSRNTTSTDRIKGLIRQILNHPDGFTGEIIVCDNTQDIGTGINDGDNNSEDINQSVTDVVSTFYAKGYPVYPLDWKSYWASVVSEYSDGDYVNGYVYDPDTKITYPKFRTPSFNYYISFRYGVWDSLAATYDSSRLCIIDFPVLKAHSWAGSTIAIKNWIGVLTTAYSEERFGGFYDMHNYYFFGTYALVARVMAVTYPKLSIVDAAWTTTDGPVNLVDVVNTNILAASTDPVAVSWYTAKFVLTPIAKYPVNTDPDFTSLTYNVNINAWRAFLADSAGLPCTNDSSEISVYDRGILTPQFSRITEGDPVSDNGGSKSVSWVDYNNDNYPDLFVTNSNDFNFLYLNNGDATFTKITGDIIVTDGDYTDGSSRSGCTWGDYDNDGDLDVFIASYHDQPGSNEHNNYIYLNDGDGTFTKVTDGIAVNDGGASIAASWADYDNDGDLDLFVANHGDPPGYAAENFLYRNDDGVFAKITTGDIVSDVAVSNCALWGDYDGDGDLDVFVANSEGYLNNLYENDGDGTFTKITSGTVVSEGGNSFGGSWGDYDNDGDLDLFVANVGAADYLYENDGTGTFTKITEGAIVSDVGNSYGSGWADYDNDGDIDLFVSGDTANSLYKNFGNGNFLKVTTGEIATDPYMTMGAAWGDYDRDGDLDLFVANTADGNEDNALYRNSGNDDSWINIKCIGTNSNASAIGAKVRIVTTGGEGTIRQLREISGQTGYCGQSSLRAHFGLGPTAIVDSVIVEWPSGVTDFMTDVSINQFLTIIETQCGDADGDGGLNMLDILYLIGYLYKGGPAPDPLWPADVDNSDSVDMLDILYLISYLYKGGPEPVCV